MKSVRGKKAGKLDQQQLLDDHAQIAAVSKAQPISDTPWTGQILDVNENFESIARLQPRRS